MPNVSIYMIRCSLCWMLLGGLAGALLHSGNLSGLHAAPLALHQFLMMYGWALQFTLAVAWWMFPRLGKNKRPADGPMWAVAGLFQLAIIIVILNPGWQPLGNALIFTGCAIFVRYMLKRVKPRGHAH